MSSRPAAAPNSHAAHPHAGGVRTDREILREVRSILADPRHSPEGNEIDAAVCEGVVTLRGTTLYPRDRAAVRRAVGRVPGVVAVGCDLRARRQEPAWA